MNENIQNKDNRNFPDSEAKGKILDYSSKYKVPYTLTKEEALQKLNEKIVSGAKTENVRPFKNFRLIYKF
jgi:hypothetical protein